MAKSHSKYVCQQCGYSQTGWAGKCPECGSWGSLVETVQKVTSSGKGKDNSTVSAVPVSLSAVKPQLSSRVSTKISELDRVLGGGLVPGQVVLLAGEPGIGKSTLLLQASYNLGECLYVSGEESASQVKLRADRLKINTKRMSFIEGTNIDATISAVEELCQKGQKPESLIIDSVQTMYTGDLSGMAGSVGQVREVSYRLVQLAKSRSIPTIIVGHVTKEGSVAGPATLMHLVDTVLWFEGDSKLLIRMLRAVKNRFGPTDEMGLFQMNENGLISIDNINSLFTSEDTETLPGSVKASVMEGTRSVIVEIQSLVVRSHTPYPKRNAQGIDPRRLELILAVLTRRCGLPLYDWDVFVNVVGGITLKEPAADLAIALSIASAFKDKPIPKGTVAIGEVGLLGEVRSVLAEEKRIKEASRQGLKNVVNQAKYPSVNKAIKILQK